MHGLITFWRNVNRNVLVLGLSSSFATFGNTIWLFFFPLILEGQGLGVSEVGLVYGIGYGCSALLQIPAGLFADRFGRKTAVVVGSVVPAVTVLILSFSTNYFLSSIAFIAFISVGGSFMAVGRSALITESVPRAKLATSFGSFTTMAGWLSAFAPVLGSLYLEKDPRVILLTSVFLYSGVAIVRAIFLRETLHNPLHQEEDLSSKLPKEQATKFFSNLKLIISNRLLLALTIAYAIYGVLFEQPSFIVTIYGSKVIHLNSFELGLLFSIFLVVDSQLQIPFGMLADRYEKRKIIIVSWIGEMTLMMVFAYSVGPLFALLSFAGWTAFGGLDRPSISALLGIITSTKTRGLSFGFFNSFSELISIPAPIITGFLYTSNVILPFYVLLAIDFVALLFFIRFTKTTIS